MSTCISQKGSDHPALKYLRFVRDLIADRWYDIGLELLEQKDESAVNMIKKNNAGNVTECCTEMLELWLSRQPNATWNQLIKALKAPGIELNNAASKIEEMLLPSAAEDSDNALLGVSSERKRKINNDASDLTLEQTDTKKVKAEDKIDGDDCKIDFKSCGNVRVAFNKLLKKFQTAVNSLNNDDFCMMKIACVIQAREPLRSSLRRASDGHRLFEALSKKDTNCNWIQLSFLEIIAGNYVNDSLVHLIDSYKKAIFSKKLYEVWKSLPHSSHKIDKYYSKIKQKLGDRNPDDMTVQELLDSQPQLTMKIALLIGVVQANSLLISWLIPTDEVYEAYLSFLTVPHYSRKDAFIQFGNWVAHSPECVLQEEQKKFGILPASTLLIAYYHGLLLRDTNFDLLMGDLYCNELLTAHQQAVIFSGHSLHHRNWLLLEHACHMDTKSLLVFSELVKRVWPHIGVQLLTALRSDDICSEIQEDRKIQNTKIILNDKVSYIDPSSVLLLFFQVSEYVVESLGSCHIKVLVDICEKLMASSKHAINYFSGVQLKKFKQSEKSPLLLQRLSLFFTWSNHSILRVLAEQCSEAVNILDDFDSRLDYFHLIASYPIPRFSFNMIPVDTSTHTILAIRCDQQLYETTLQYVYDMQSVMMQTCDITQHCLQLLAVRSDPTILYWTIPKCVVDLINTNVSRNSEYLYLRGILEVLVYPDLLLASGDDICHGSFAFCDNSKIIERKHDETQDYQQEIKGLQKTLECLKVEKIALTEKLEDLNVALEAKELSYKTDKQDKVQLFKKNTELKLKLQDTTEKMVQLSKRNTELRLKLQETTEMMVKKITSVTSVEDDSPWIEEVKNDNNEKGTEIETLQALKPPVVSEGRSPSSTLTGNFWNGHTWMIFRRSLNQKL